MDDDAVADVRRPLLYPRPPSPSRYPLLRRPLSLLGRLLILPSADAAAASVSAFAAREMEELSGQASSDWGYSRPVVVLDVVWNVAFVFLTAAVLFSTLKERPAPPLRLWLSGYALQCLLHIAFVLLEYRLRARPCARLDGVFLTYPDERSSSMKRLESMNTLASFLWWLVGFYWIVVGGQAIIQDAPRLYWLTVVFLAFDVFFTIFCVLLAFLIGVALCCCLPCIIAFLYAIAGQEGASEADINILPRLCFREVSEHGEESFTLDKQEAIARTMRHANDGSSPTEVALSRDDSECCICLAHYEDGVELRSLPCNHHFHSGCIIKWLRINATCPLCKYNILRADEQV